MFVYVITRSWDWEGSDVVAVASNIDAAFRIAQDVVLESSFATDKAESLQRWTKAETPCSPSVEDWCMAPTRCGIDYVEISKVEVQS